MKRYTTIAVFSAWVILVLMLFNSVRVLAQGPPGDDAQRIQRGLEIAPVSLNLEGRDASLVGLGSYLVNSPAGCAGCHTSPTFAPGGNPFVGQPERINAGRYLAGGGRFGPFISLNLTPDPQTGLPAGLTFDEFQRALRMGEDNKRVPPPVPSPARDTLQVMPWPEYSKLIDRDLRAIYEYLRAVPSRLGYPRTPAVTATAATVAPGSTITGNWFGLSARPANDWIGLYAVGAADSQENIIGGANGWRYTGGAASGSLTLPAPMEPGQYELRYFVEDSFVRIDQSNPVTVR